MRCKCNSLLEKIAFERLRVQSRRRRPEKPERRGAALRYCSEYTAQMQVEAEMAARGASGGPGRGGGAAHLSSLEESGYSRFFFRSVRAISETSSWRSFTIGSFPARASNERSICLQLASDRSRTRATSPQRRMYRMCARRSGNRVNVDTYAGVLLECEYCTFFALLENAVGLLQRDAVVRHNQLLRRRHDLRECNSRWTEFMRTGHITVHFDRRAYTSRMSQSGGHRVRS